MDLHLGALRWGKDRSWLGGFPCALMTKRPRSRTKVAKAPEPTVIGTFGNCTRSPPPPRRNAIRYRAAVYKPACRSCLTYRGRPHRRTKRVAKLGDELPREMGDKGPVGACLIRALFSIFMSSRNFDFGTAIWDYRFSESMESLLSPVRIASNERAC